MAMARYDKNNISRLSQNQDIQNLIGAPAIAKKVHRQALKQSYQELQDASMHATQHLMSSQSPAPSTTNADMQRIEGDQNVLLDSRNMLIRHFSQIDGSQVGDQEQENQSLIRTLLSKKAGVQQRHSSMSGIASSTVLSPKNESSWRICFSAKYKHLAKEISEEGPIRNRISHGAYLAESRHSKTPSNQMYAAVPDSNQLAQNKTLNQAFKEKKSILVHEKQIKSRKKNNQKSNGSIARSKQQQRVVGNQAYHHMPVSGHITVAQNRYGSNVTDALQKPKTNSIASTLHMQGGLNQNQSSPETIGLPNGSSEKKTDQYGSPLSTKFRSRQRQQAILSGQDALEIVPTMILPDKKGVEPLIKATQPTEKNRVTQGEEPGKLNEDQMAISTINVPLVNVGDQDLDQSLNRPAKPENLTNLVNYNDFEDVSTQIRVEIESRSTPRIVNPDPLTQKTLQREGSKNSLASNGRKHQSKLKQDIQNKLRISQELSSAKRLMPLYKEMQMQVAQEIRKSNNYHQNKQRGRSGKGRKAAQQKAQGMHDAIEIKKLGAQQHSRKRQSLETQKINHPQQQSTPGFKQNCMSDQAYTIEDDKALITAYREAGQDILGIMENSMQVLQPVQSVTFTRSSQDIAATSHEEFAHSPFHKGQRHEVVGAQDYQKYILGGEVISNQTNKHQVHSDKMKKSVAMLKGQRRNLRELIASQNDPRQPNSAATANKNLTGINRGERNIQRRTYQTELTGQYGSSHLNNNDLSTPFQQHGYKNNQADDSSQALNTEDYLCIQKITPLATEPNQNAHNTGTFNNPIDFIDKSKSPSTSAYLEQAAAGKPLLMQKRASVQGSQHAIPHRSHTPSSQPDLTRLQAQKEDMLGTFYKNKKHMSRQNARKIIQQSSPQTVKQLVVSQKNEKIGTGCFTDSRGTATNKSTFHKNHEGPYKSNDSNFENKNQVKPQLDGSLELIGSNKILQQQQSNTFTGSFTGGKNSQETTFNKDYIAESTGNTNNLALQTEGNPNDFELPESSKVHQQVKQTRKRIELVSRKQVNRPLQHQQLYQQADTSLVNSKHSAQEVQQVSKGIGCSLSQVTDTFMQQYEDSEEEVVDDCIPMSSILHRDPHSHRSAVSSNSKNSRIGDIKIKVKKRHIQNPAGTRLLSQKSLLKQNSSAKRIVVQRTKKTIQGLLSTSKTSFYKDGDTLLTDMPTLQSRKVQPNLKTDSVSNFGTRNRKNQTISAEGDVHDSAGSLGQNSKAALKIRIKMPYKQNKGGSLDSSRSDQQRTLDDASNMKHPRDNDNAYTLASHQQLKGVIDVRELEDPLINARKQQHFAKNNPMGLSGSSTLRHQSSILASIQPSMRGDIGHPQDAKQRLQRVVSHRQVVQDWLQNSGAEIPTVFEQGSPSPSTHQYNPHPIYTTQASHQGQPLFRQRPMTDLDHHHQQQHQHGAGYVLNTGSDLDMFQVLESGHLSQRGANAGDQRCSMHRIPPISPMYTTAAQQNQNNQEDQVDKDLIMHIRDLTKEYRKQSRDQLKQYAYTGHKSRSTKLAQHHKTAVSSSLKEQNYQYHRQQQQVMNQKMVFSRSRGDDAGSRLKAEESCQQSQQDLVFDAHSYLQKLQNSILNRPSTQADTSMNLGTGTFYKEPGSVSNFGAQQKTSQYHAQSLMSLGNKRKSALQPLLSSTNYSALAISRNNAQNMVTSSNLSTSAIPRQQQPNQIKKKQFRMKVQGSGVNKTATTITSKSNIAQQHRGASTTTTANQRQRQAVQRALNQTGANQHQYF